MNADLSRRLGRALGAGRPVPLQQRVLIIAAAKKVDTWQQLPADVRALVQRIERRQPTA